MSELIEFDPVDRIVVGALGEPGRRTFLIQADRGDSRLTVLVEKEQVAVLAARVLQLLAELGEGDLPAVEEVEALLGRGATIVEPVEPLFRTRMMRLGYDPGRELLVLELFEDAPEDVPKAEAADESAGEAAEEAGEEEQAHVARLVATPAQMAALATRGAQAVAAGRPICPLCLLPKDSAGHDCPSKN